MDIHPSISLPNSEAIRRTEGRKTKTIASFDVTRKGNICRDHGWRFDAATAARCNRPTSSVEWYQTYSQVDFDDRHSLSTTSILFLQMWEDQYQSSRSPWSSTVALCCLWERLRLCSIVRRRLFSGCQCARWRWLFTFTSGREIRFRRHHACLDRSWFSGELSDHRYWSAIVHLQYVLSGHRHWTVESLFGEQSHWMCSSVDLFRCDCQSEVFPRSWNQCFTLWEPRGTGADPQTWCRSEFVVSQWSDAVDQSVPRRNSRRCHSALSLRSERQLCDEEVSSEKRSAHCHRNETMWYYRTIARSRRLREQTSRSGWFTVRVSHSQRSFRDGSITAR